MATKPPKTRKASPALISPSDVRAYIRGKAAVVAPADVETLTACEAEILARAEQETDHPRLRRQAEFAVRLLQDHASGAAPQIPYFTVSLLAAALFYYLDRADLIPDWIPKVGTSDDALVVELAFEMGAGGVQRYCDFKGISTEGLLPPAKSRRAAPKRK